MKQIQFAQTYNNEAAHRQVKLLMKQHKQLYIQVNGEAWISSQGVTSIRYQLNAQGWQWILNYLQTGDYEDFGVFPSRLSKLCSEFQEDVDEFIGIKSFKAKGKRISTYNIEQINELEPLRFPEPSKEEDGAEEGTDENEETAEIEDPDHGKSETDIIDEITGQMKLF